MERHEPSRDIEVSDLYQKLSVATQRGWIMGDHVHECMTYRLSWGHTAGSYSRNRLKALDAEIPRELFFKKLLDADKEYMFMRVSVRTQPLEQVVAALMEQYQLFQRHRVNDRIAGSSPAGKLPKFNRPRS